MTPRQIEAWAIRVLEQVEKKQNVEDTLVELKAEWPRDPNKAARRIGGHANAARGEPVLWLIGADEKAGRVVGAPLSEFANWYPAVEKEFEGIAPRCIPLNIPRKNGTTVVALVFETDRAPHVVRNSAYNQPGGGPVAFEIPWRNGSRTDSAKRADLFKMLAPAAQLPDVELLAAGLWAKEVNEAAQRPQHIEWRLDVYLFVAPRGDSRVVIPAHRCEASILPSEAGGYALPLSGFQFTCDPPNIHTKNAATVNTPGLVTVVARYIHTGYALPLKSETVRVMGKARPVGADAWIDWGCELRRCFPERRDHAGIWGIGPFTSF